MKKRGDAAAVRHVEIVAVGADRDAERGGEQTEFAEAGAALHAVVAQAADMGEGAAR